MDISEKNHCPYDDPDCLNCPFDECIVSDADIVRQDAFRRKKKGRKKLTTFARGSHVVKQRTKKAV